MLEGRTREKRKKHSTTKRPKRHPQSVFFYKIMFPGQLETLN